MTIEFNRFLHDTSAEDLPEGALPYARKVVLDLVGVLVGGKTTQLAQLISNHACEQFAAGANNPATILFDGRSASPAGAALANGMTLDSLDAHDGHKLTKGHIGCNVFPALLALCEAENKHDGKEFLTAVALGYEIGMRAGVSLHASVPDYHTSGAWGAVTCAALGARVMGLDEQVTREAVGIGEYHGPRSQMMRCIDHPTMLKDGSGWGAMAGVSAAYLARSGFTGAPAITIEGEDVAGYWADLGDHWTFFEQYFKPYPVCRWAQPAVEATLTIARDNKLTAHDISEIEVHSFHEACRLATRRPSTTEQAQYSLPYPVAAALVYGGLGPREVSPEALNNPEVWALADSMVLLENDQYNADFPKERYAHVVVKTHDGRKIKSERHSARGDPEDPFGDEEIVAKFYSIVEPVVGEKRARRIEETINELGKGADVRALLEVTREAA